QQLSLEGNRIEEIQPGAFGHLGSLTVLDLRANALVYLPDMVFQGLQALRWLRLSHNALHVLGSEAFAALPALRRLSLDHNELQALPGAGGLAKVSLAGNPLLCSCLLRPFHVWLARARVQAEGSCAAPPALRGRPL
ncbi:Chondroadherin-like, partial [Calypte anna]